MWTQRCVKCRTYKPEDQGKWVKSSTRYNKRYFICATCDTPLVLRLCRKNQESPPEAEVRKALATCGFTVKAEYPLGRYIYDFSVPKLHLLIELDSPSYHRFPRQKRRDRIKTKLAEDAGWTLKRFSTSTPQLPLAVVLCVKSHASLIGFC